MKFLEEKNLLTELFQSDTTADLKLESLLRKGSLQMRQVASFLTAGAEQCVPCAHFILQTWQL